MPRPTLEPVAQNLRGGFEGEWEGRTLFFFLNFLGDHNERASLKTIELNVSNVELLINISL